MVIQDGKARDVRIAYIGGGSRGWAWTLMTDLAREDALSGTVALYDIDSAAAARNAVIGNRTCDRWTYETAETLEAALTGADFVIISILPGTFDQMEADVHLPERCGIYQSVGDTAGPGGLTRAMRTLPMFVTIAEAIRDHAPKAWVINYTNPLALCVRTLYTVFPEIRAFGCCHEVFGTQELLAEIAQAELGLSERPRRQDIIIDVTGVNHFTWITKAGWQGVDLMPVFADYSRKHFEEGLTTRSDNWMNSYFSCAHRVKFDLFRRCGAIAAAGDRHLAEFMPWTDYLKDPARAAEWKFSLTPVSWRKADLRERLLRSERLFAGEETLALRPTGEEGTKLIKALCGLTRVISNVDLPDSCGQVAGVEPGTVVETNAVFSVNGIQPVCAGMPPEPVAALLRPHIENQRDILIAALERDFALALKAFMNEPLVRGRVSGSEGERLLRDMLRASREYLPAEWESEL